MKTIEKLLKGINVWDEFPEINYNLGMLYLNLNNLNEAEKYALRATKSSQFFKLTKKEKEKGCHCRLFAR